MSTSTALYICFLCKITDTLSKTETGPRVLFGLFHTDALKLEMRFFEIIIIVNCYKLWIKRFDKKKM